MPDSDFSGDRAGPVPARSAGRRLSVARIREAGPSRVALLGLAALLAACQPLQRDTDAGTTDAVPPAVTRQSTPARPAPPPGAATRPTPSLNSVARIPEAEPVDDGPGDLLARVRAGFALPVLDDAAIDHERTRLAGQQAFIDRVFERGAPFLHFIVEELETRGMPTDYALLPVIESAFDPLAYSHGRAAGMWQIIPGTGRRFDLKQNWWYDGRRDVIESTRAALDYLQYLHQFFDGDWLLATAAYNAGEGNVARAVRRAEAAGQRTDFFSLRRHLPRETRAYVPRLLALRDLIAAPEKHEVLLPEIADEPQFAVVDTGGQIDMSIAASLAGLETDALYALNPGVNRWATDPDGPHRLLVPTTHAQTLASAIATLDDDARVRWARHTIESGDTLIAIAARYQTTVDVLREANGLRGHLIRAGDDLLIPLGERAGTNGNAAAALAQLGGAVAERQVTYTVRRGDSLYSIARRFRVTIGNLVEWNDVSTARYLQPGQRLVVFLNVADQSG